MTVRQLGVETRERLRMRCFQEWGELTAGMVQLGTDAKDRHAFLDNGGSVLAVAHHDFVAKCEHFDSAILDTDELLYCGRLDDRLGAFTILDVLPALGLRFDVLITDNEEIGASTAGDFVHSKQYNWMFQFDRRGTGCVTYSYTGKEWLDSLGKYFRIDNGTFSDICMLEGLGCQGVNVGTGYYNEHTTTHHFSVREWSAQVVNFAKFFKKNCDTHFPFTPKPRMYSSGYGRSYRYGGSYYYDPTEDDSIMDDKDGGFFWCEDCQAYMQECDTHRASNGTLLCRECGTEVVFDEIAENDFKKGDEEWI